MAATPTFRLAGTGGTVILEWEHAPERFDRRSDGVPMEIRRKLAADDETPGDVNLIYAPWQKSGQTMSVSIRLITPDMDTLLSAWNRSKEVLTYNSTEKVVIQVYRARPRNVLHRHTVQIEVEELTLIWLEDDA